MQELRVAEIRALSDLGGTFLEVAGKVVVRHGRRLYDYANHPDPMMDLEEASVRFHARGASSEWQPAGGLTVNRDELLVLCPRDGADSTQPGLREQDRELLLNIICGPLQIGGALTVPLEATISEFMHQARWRFLPVARAKIRTHQDGISLGDFQEGAQLCYVNRKHISACVESRQQPRTGSSFATE